MKICFVTGGTGGHIYPALALADKMQELDSSTKILFIGNDDRMEKDLVPQNGYAFKALHTSGLVGNAFKKCMEAMHEDITEWYYVGDNYINDMQGAKSAGMKTIHFNRHHQVSGPCADHVVYSAKELVEFIKKD